MDHLGEEMTMAHSCRSDSIRREAIFKVVNDVIEDNEWVPSMKETLIKCINTLSFEGKNYIFIDDDNMVEVEFKTYLNDKEI
jgi:hypothetical protein